MTADDFFKAEEYLRAGDVAGAAELLRAVTLKIPGHVAAWRKLADALAILGDTSDAATARQAADRAQAKHLAEVGATLMFNMDGDRARMCFERALVLDPDCLQAHWLLGDHLGRNGERDEALAHFRRCTEIEPTLEAPGFMAAAYGEGEKPGRAPDDYVAEYFDWYAHRFDEHLTKGLNYVGPRVTTESLSTVRAGRLGRVLDLGCGTGLVGAELGDRSDHLVGLDLSSQMLEIARKRDIYDELIEGEIVASLANMSPAVFDAVVATDVLVYVGALEATFEQVRRVLAEDGVFVATFEAAESEATWVLTETGRYQHSPGYLEATAHAAGFAHVTVAEATLREEYGEPVKSLVATFLVSE